MAQGNYLLVSRNDTLVQVMDHVVGSRLGCLSTAQDSDEASRFLESARCEAVFVDATQVASCQPIRSRWHGPIVLLVSTEAKSATLHGYQNGADLAIPLPCDFRELVARVQALTRRSLMRPS
jgi:two-component system response regulator CpxR